MAEGLPDRGLRSLIALCSRHWLLHRWLDPLHEWAVRRGLEDLTRADGFRLLERAHVQAMSPDCDRNDVQAMASRALDRFERLAGQGDAEAAFEVAEAYRTGFGRPGNHWLALEAYDRAAALGHPQAAERHRALAEREPIQDDRQGRFARQALIKATYARTTAQHHGQTLGRHLRVARVEGLGLRSSLAILGSAALILIYIFLDMYFLGLGHWRPDPTRVAWGLVGRIHPPRGGGPSMVLPGWLRQDAGDVTFTEVDQGEHTARVLTVRELQGQVVYLHVIDAQHPLLFESQNYLARLTGRLAGQCKVCILYLPGGRDTNVALMWIKEIANLNASYAHDPRGVRPLGTISAFPMNFVIDRRGRIRQRWVGFGPELTDACLAAAIAEDGSGT